MKTKREIATDIWKSHENYLGKTSVELHKPNIADFMANLFCPGPHYYYVIDSPTLTLDMASRDSRDILGIEPEALSVEKFINLIHPEDMDFFFRCEDVVAYFLKKCITPDKMPKYKITYCLRERIRDGSYHLFLLQTITMQTTRDGALLKVFGSHTDIQHITSVNNRKLSFIGLYGEPSFLEIDVFEAGLFDDFTPYNYNDNVSLFTKRELEVIRLLGAGLSAPKIADELHISSQTVITHRKNILRKSGVKNTAELVADCIRKGYI